MKIRDLLGGDRSADVKGVHPDSSLLDASNRMASYDVSALVVTGDGGKTLGIITERDLARVIATFGHSVAEKTVRDVMTPSLITCTAEDQIADVLSLMRARGIRHVPVADGHSLIGMVSIRDLTRAYEAVQVQATIDGLTGLLNRRCFLEDLENELDRSRRYRRPLSLAMIDVDLFKRVNDTYGHSTGDRVLSTIARVLIDSLRTIDRVGRLGGEEFGIIFPDTEIDSAKLACDRLLKSIRETSIEVDEFRISVTVSIGLTDVNPCPEEDTDLSGVLIQADRLLYLAKARGRDCICTKSALGHSQLGHDIARTNAL